MWPGFDPVLWAGDCYRLTPTAGMGACPPPHIEDNQVSCKDRAPFNLPPAFDSRVMQVISGICPKSYITALKARDMKRLQDKVALITGGAAGIGKATAALFLREGARVMLVDIHEEALKEAIGELGHENTAYCVADVSEASQVKKYVKATLDAFGRIDVFFNNAGIEGNSMPMAEYPEAVFDKVLAVNVKGVWLGCQHVLPVLSEGGSAIITSSVAGLKGMQGLGAYVTSKHAVIGIMRVAALEFADRKIRVNTVHPGPVNTLMMERIEADVSPDDTRQARQGFEAMVPLKRYAEPGEVADLVLFLASDESRYISGNTYVIDGGMMAK